MTRSAISLTCGPSQRIDAAARRKSILDQELPTNATQAMLSNSNLQLQGAQQSLCMVRIYVLLARDKSLSQRATGRNEDLHCGTRTG